MDETGAKITALDPLTDGASDDLLAIVDVSDNNVGEGAMSVDGTNKKMTLENLVNSLGNLGIITPVNGWIPAGETWTYAGADDPTFTFKVNADVTGKYSAGMKIKLTQTTVKYFIITAVSAYSGGYTTITVYGGTDYDLASSAISANYYSTQKAPQGFPLSPAKWTEELEDTTNRTQASPSANVWYNMGSLSLSIPIGAWDVSYDVTGYVLGSAGENDINMRITLSTANNSASDVSWCSYIWFRNDNISTRQQGIMQTVHREGFLTLSSKASYYLNGQKPGSSSADSISFYNSNQPCIIRATCAYL